MYSKQQAGKQCKRANVLKRALARLHCFPACFFLLRIICFYFVIIMMSFRAHLLNWRKIVN